MGSRFYTLIPPTPSSLGRKKRLRKDKVEDEEEETYVRGRRAPRGRNARRREEKARRRRES